jgi:HNH endonuclease
MSKSRNKTPNDLPSKTSIVEYWIKWEQDNGKIPPWCSGWGWDWGEPACMACGYFSPHWPCEPGPKGASPWQHQSVKLERCHVIARSLGGSVDPSNFVLMCSDCHKHSPDTMDADYLYQWMKDREKRSYGGFRFNLVPEFTQLAERSIAAGLTGDEVADAIRQGPSKPVGSHFERMSDATVVYAANKAIDELIARKSGASS